MIKYKLISCLLATIPIWLHLAMDIYKQKHKITINHAQSAIVAVVSSFLVGLCSFDEKLQFTSSATNLPIMWRGLLRFVAILNRQ
jgi:undecaprenyl pyrophosphate phosphatase UppP